MEYKSGFATVFGRKFEVRFHEDSNEYFELHTQQELNGAARAEILAKLNELVEVGNPDALATLHYAADDPTERLMKAIYG